MRVFSFNGVIYDGYLTYDLITFVLKQRFSRVFKFKVLIPDLISFLLRRTDITQFLEKVYKVLLDNVTVSEINLFKVNNIHKIDLEGFGIVKDNPNDIILTWEPSFLVDLFINRNKYNVICTEYDLHTRKIIGKVCVHEDKIATLRKHGIDHINQLFVYSFKEKELLSMADYVFVYRDHELIEYEAYEGTMRDQITYSVTNQRLISYVFIAFISLLFMFVFATIAAFFVDGVFAFLLGYIMWFSMTYIVTLTYVNKKTFTVDHLFNYFLGIIPNFLLQLFLVIVFCEIIGLYSWFVILISSLLAFPLLVFLLKFYKFD